MPLLIVSFVYGFVMQEAAQRRTIYCLDFKKIFEIIPRAMIWRIDKEAEEF